MRPNYGIFKHRRSNNYQLRYYIPKHLQKALGGRKEILRTLGTANRIEANGAVTAVAAKIQKEIRLATTATKAHVSAPPPESSHDRIEAAARAFYKDQVESDQEELADPDNIKLMGRGGEESSIAYKAEAERLRKTTGDGEALFSADEVQEWAWSYGLQLNENSPKENQFRQLIKRAYIEALERASEHDIGDFGGQPTDPVFKRSDAAPSAPIVLVDKDIGSGDTLLDLWDEYVRLKGRAYKPDTLLSRKKALELFADFVGPKTQINVISKKHARDWVNVLHHMPIKAAEITDFAGLSMVDIIELNKSVGRPTIKVPTINQRISNLKTYYQWLKASEYVDKNIFDDLAIEPGPSGSDRPPFSISQLQALFSSPLFLGCEGASKPSLCARYGKLLLRDWRFWLPLLAAFTGARQAELAQLAIDDVKSDGGIDYLFITDQGTDDTKSIKNRSSERSIPLHSKLIKLGFLDYVSTQKSSGKKRVFPELTRDQKGQFGSASKFFASYIRHIGLRAEPHFKMPVFHSFRHSVVDELRQKHSHEQIRPLIGHKSNSTIDVYGKSQIYSLQVRKAMIEEIKYEGLDVSKITPFKEATQIGR